MKPATNPDREMNKPHLKRQLGLWNATSINMSNMVGSGTFVTLPLMLGAMGGPQAMTGWVAGAVIALADGLVWSELATSFPGSGGTYVYLRESFGRERWGRLLSFLFVFQMILSGPLEIASGNIAIAEYARYLWRSMTNGEARLLAAGVGVLGTILLWRKIASIAKLMLVLWAGMLVSVAAVIVVGALHFHPDLAFSFPRHAFGFGTGFILGLGSATLYSMYCYLGYYGICYLGDEVRDPASTIPRSILYSVGTVAVINILFCFGILGSLPWREVLHSHFMVCAFMERLYGRWAGITICLLMMWTSFAAIYAMILTYSRIPYAAALDGNFFRIFGRLHQKKDFPHYSLGLIGGLAVAASLLNLAEVINALVMARILIQFLGQIIALLWLRARRPEIARPFRMLLYPLPCFVAFAGWAFIFFTAQARFILFGLLTLAAGAAIFLIGARRKHIWPFAISDEARLIEV